MLAGRLVRTEDRVSPTRQVWRRRVAKYSRWLHIYVSMVSCVVVLFFAATGVTLNHTEWFASAERTTQATGTLDRGWIAGTASVDELRIAEYLRSTHNLRGAVTDFRADDQQISLSFKGPGYSADVFADRVAGTYELTETRLGVVAIANDLHKGRDSGGVWKAVIDVSAILLALISLSGLVLLYFIHKHRVAGLVLLGIGGLLTWGAYATFVP
jgi:hypothetical protein